MSDDLEQQAEEIEALSSIFPNEFTVLEGTDKESSLQKYSSWKQLEITNLVKLHLQPQEPDSNGNIHVEAIFIAAMVKDYPSSSSLQFEVENKKGFSPDQLEEIKKTCQSIAIENLGMPIIFMITTAIQEWLQENNIPGHDGSMYADMMRRMQKNDLQEKKAIEKAAIKAAADNESKPEHVDLEELERIRKRQAGQPVTVETFMKWKKAFDEEMASKQAQKQLSPDDLKPTGKQWFFGFFGDNADIEKMIQEAEQEEITEEKIVAELTERAEIGEEGEDDEDDEDYVDEEEDGNNVKHEEDV